MLLGEALPRRAAGGLLLIQRSRHARGPAPACELEHGDAVFIGPEPDPERIPLLDGLDALGALSVQLDASRFDRGRCERTGLEEAGGLEPEIEADIGHRLSAISLTTQ